MGSSAAWRMSFPSDLVGPNLFQTAESHLQTDFCESGSQQPVLLTLAGRGPCEFGQFQGRPEAILNC